MDETFFQKAVHALVFVAICAAIISLGWNEPLRYRFMATEQIAAEQEALHPTPVPVPRTDPTNWRPTGTALDRAPWEVTKGELEYSRNIDPRKMGAPTETDRRPNTTGKR